MTAKFMNNAVEIGCLLIVLLIFILISLTRTASSFRDRLFKLNLLCFGNSCVSSIIYNGLLPLYKQGRLSEVYIYFMHNSFYINLLVMFVFYITYISDLFSVSKDKLKIINILKWCIFSISSAIILTSNLTHFGFYIRLCHNKQLINSHFYRGVSELPYKLGLVIYKRGFTNLRFSFMMKAIGLT